MFNFFEIANILDISFLICVTCFMFFLHSINTKDTKSEDKKAVLMIILFLYVIYLEERSLGIMITVLRVISWPLLYVYNSLVSCSSDNVPYRIDWLHNDVEQNLFGQPLAIDLVDILNGHKKSIDKRGRKALSVSLQGLPGTGKNYMSSLIAKALYRQGIDSPNVKLYIGRTDFSLSGSIVEYQQRVKNEIDGMVKKCGEVLIIFDEVDDIPPGVLDVLKPMLDYYDHPIDGLDYRKAIFMFLSNINGDEIAKHFVKLKKDRNVLKLSDFDEVIRNGSVFASGGLKDSRMIYSHLIDHFIPFLPLEKDHVRQCVKAEFQRQNYLYNRKDIEDAIEVLTFKTEDNLIYSTSGCKRIHKQVSLIIQKRLKEQKREL